MYATDIQLIILCNVSADDDDDAVDYTNTHTHSLIHIENNFPYTYISQLTMQIAVYLVRFSVCVLCNFVIYFVMVRNAEGGVKKWAFV